MVRFIITIVFVHSFFLCVGQAKHLDNKIELKASFSSDCIFMEDSLKLLLYYRNNSSNNFTLYPKAIIGLSHNHKGFITYDKPERIVYMLHSVCDYDSIVILKSGEEFKSVFDIKIDSNYFYEGENTVLVFYHFFAKPITDKKRKKTKKEPILSLWSSAIKIKVQSDK